MASSSLSSMLATLEKKPSFSFYFHLKPRYWNRGFLGLIIKQLLPSISPTDIESICSLKFGFMLQEAQREAAQLEAAKTPRFCQRQLSKEKTEKTKKAKKTYTRIIKALTRLCQQTRLQRTVTLLLKGDRFNCGSEKIVSHDPFRSLNSTLRRWVKSRIKLLIKSSLKDTTSESASKSASRYCRLTKLVIFSRDVKGLKRRSRPSVPGSPPAPPEFRNLYDLCTPYILSDGRNAQLPLRATFPEDIFNYMIQAVSTLYVQIIFHSVLVKLMPFFVAPLFAVGLKEVYTAGKLLML